MNYSGVFRHSVDFIYGLLNDDLKAVFDVVGDCFDEIKSTFDTILTQIDAFQLTPDGLLSEHESFYQIKSTGTTQERVNRVIAAIRSKGGLNISHFYRIADALGYEIGSGVKYLIITENDFAPWRVGISRLGIDEIWPLSGSQTMYTVSVIGTDVETDADLQRLFNKQVCAGVSFLFQNV